MTRQTGTALSQLVGVYQLASGIIGLMLMLYSSYFNFRVNLFFFLYSIIVMSLLILGVYAGYKCLTNTALGLKLTLYNQLVQFVSFTLVGFNYTYSAGLSCYVGIDVTETTKFITEFKLLSIGIGKADQQLKIFLVNLFPIVIVFLLEPITNALLKVDD